MRRLLTTIVLAAVMCVSTQAATVTFDLFTPNNSSNFTSPVTFMSNPGTTVENGVSFVSTVELSALAGSNLFVDNNATTVVSAAGSSEINTGEGINFAIAPNTSEVGGTAVFVGFESITFDEFDPGDSGTVNGQVVTSNGAFNFTPGSLPTTIALLGTGDAPSGLGQDGFSVTQVTAVFTTTAASAVPEPSSLATLLLVGGCAVMRRRRK